MPTHLTPAPGRGSSGLSVDYAALTSLQGALRALSQEMQQPHGSLSAQLDPDIAVALLHAEADWHTHRTALARFFATAADGINGALTEYRATEQAITDAARPGGR